MPKDPQAPTGHPVVDESMGDLLNEAERARDVYDGMLRKLLQQSKKSPELMAQVQKWRADVDEMLRHCGRGKDAPRS